LPIEGRKSSLDGLAGTEERELRSVQLDSAIAGV
jgi:hypothetical protein